MRVKWVLQDPIEIDVQDYVQDWIKEAYQIYDILTDQVYLHEIMKMVFVLADATDMLEGPPFVQVLNITNIWVHQILVVVGNTCQQFDCIQLVWVLL